MFNSKYSNILTMLLIIFIVAIIGIIAYFAYDLFNSSSINNNAQSAIDQFETVTKTVKKNNSKFASSDSANSIAENTTTSMSDLTSQMAGNTTEPSQETTKPVTQEKPVEEERERVYMENYEIVGTIEIPKIKVKYPILSEVTKRSLEIAVACAYGPGFRGSGLVNDPGNTIIYGHNYRNGLFFSNVKKLANGDKIFVTDATGNKVTYIIYNIYQTDPSDASYFTRETNGRSEISLQTCTDDSSARIIVWAAPAE